MGDPELRSDETVLLRTPGIYVKSIQFEATLTNKRIILVDRTKNLPPPKEIPLATIKEVVGGENAIRDPIIMVTVIARTGETRQIILTFFPTSAGNRLKERDEWVKSLKENVSSTFEQVIRRVIPGSDQPRGMPGTAASPRIEVAGLPVQPGSPLDAPAAARPLPKKEIASVHPIRKIIENVSPATPAGVKESDGSARGPGTFCNRCGYRVTGSSGFCTRCGSPVIVPVSTTPSAQQIPAAPAPHPAVPDYQAQRPIYQEIQAPEPLIRRLPGKEPADPLRAVPPEPPAQKSASPSYSPLYDNPPQAVTGTPQPVPAVTAPSQKPRTKRLIPRLFSPNELASTPLNPASMPTAIPPAPQKPRGSRRMPGKIVFIAIGVVILLIIVVAAAVLVYPKVTGSGSFMPGTKTPSATLPFTPAPSGTVVIPATTASSGVPATGVYVHISYIGGWNGTYGMPPALQKVTKSGEQFYEIENATGPVEATFEKLDNTRSELVLEIYRNGGLLTSGKTSAGFGKVTVSADSTTGIAQPPQEGTGTLATTAVPASSPGSFPAGNVTATRTPAANVTTVEITASPSMTVTRQTTARGTNNTAPAP